MTRRARRHIGTGRGFTLVDIAIILVIGGTIVQMMLRGQELIQSAHVREIMSQQAAVEAAVVAFQDRFRYLPGDYPNASSNIKCDDIACAEGNGNGRVEAGTNGALHEEILAWHHLRAAGFIQGDYSMADSAVTQADASNTPTNAFGGFLELGYDSQWGYSGNAAVRHNIKTGNQVSASVLGEIDRKIDDGLPGAGRFQFSMYAGAGTPPPAGALNGPTCTDADAPTASWRLVHGGDNCGATTLLR